MKTTSLDDLLAENLKNDDFKKEYDSLEEEFEVARQISPPSSSPSHGRIEIDSL